jgi:hypothetical protein
VSSSIATPCETYYIHTSFASQRLRPVCFLSLSAQQHRCLQLGRGHWVRLRPVETPARQSQECRTDLQDPEILRPSHCVLPRGDTQFPPNNAVYEFTSIAALDHLSCLSRLQRGYVRPMMLYVSAHRIYGAVVRKTSVMSRSGKLLKREGRLCGVVCAEKSHDARRNCVSANVAPCTTSYVQHLGCVCTECRS